MDVMVSVTTDFGPTIPLEPSELCFASGSAGAGFSLAMLRTVIA